MINVFLNYLQTTGHMNQNEFFWTFTPAKVDIYQSQYTLRWLLGYCIMDFLARQVSSVSLVTKDSCMSLTSECLWLFEDQELQ